MNKKCIMIACAFFVAVALQAKVSLPAFFFGRYGYATTESGQSLGQGFER